MAAEGTGQIYIDTAAALHVSQQLLQIQLPIRVERQQQRQQQQQQEQQQEH